MPNRENPLVEEKLLKILEEAILDEQASAARYGHGAELARDPELVAMFEQLMRDEQRHEEALKERYRAIKKRLGLKIMRDGE
ncbi:MAG: ferritin-like domain-containing protein [Nitrospinae bacterium]|nr:ferritin-like domain-containing protein [Nitrospinota bacterium]